MHCHERSKDHFKIKSNYRRGPRRERSLHARRQFKDLKGWELGEGRGHARKCNNRLWSSTLSRGWERQPQKSAHGQPAATQDIPHAESRTRTGYIVRIWMDTSTTIFSALQSALETARFSALQSALALQTRAHRHDLPPSEPGGPSRTS
jgi:hypothetical protein